MNYCKNCGKPIQSGDMCCSCKKNKHFIKERTKQEEHRKDKKGNLKIFIVSVLSIILVLTVSCFVVWNTFKYTYIPNVLSEKKIINQVSKLAIYKNFDDMTVKKIQVADDNRSFDAKLYAVEENDISSTSNIISVSYILDDGKWYLDKNKQISKKVKWIFDNEEWTYLDSNIECAVSFHKKDKNYIVDYEIQVFEESQKVRKYQGQKTLKTKDRNKLILSIVDNDNENIQLNIDKDSISISVNNTVRYLNKE